MQVVHRFPDGAEVPASIKVVDELVRAQPNLLAFHKRLRDKLWPEGTTTEWQRNFGQT